jgi:dihydrolipoamide dehydrogenase
MNNSNYPLIIIGAGPGGYEAALTAKKIGIKTLLIEKNEIGGTCTNSGCIPTKSYLAKVNQLETLTAIQQATQRTLRRNRMAMMSQLKNSCITYLNDTVLDIDKNSIITTNNGEIHFDKLILATGSSAKWLPLFKELKNDDRVVTNETIFNLTNKPESLTIIGGGVIGVEFAFFFSKLGTKVTLIEIAPAILPEISPSLQKEAKQLLKRNKVTILENCAIKTINKASLTITTNEGKEVLCEHLLLATGRTVHLPTNNLALEYGFITTSPTFQTSSPNTYAIGDCNGKSLLAHSAADQGEQLVGYLFNNKEVILKAIPQVIYTSPPLVSIGLTLPQVKEMKRDFLVTKVPYGFSGKAQAEDETKGWIELYTNSDKKLLGAQGSGKNLDDLLPLLALAIDGKVTLKDLSSIIFPHPSYAELIKAAIQQI